MTPTDARKITLHELIEWCDKQMEDCETKEDNWVVIHIFGIPCEKFNDEEEVDVINADGTVSLCSSKSREMKGWVNNKWLENRKHLDTTRYQAFKEMKDKCNELMNSISVAA